MKEPTTKWIKQADYDFETAGAMMKTRRYVYVVFMCHLTLEKMLKAAYTEAKGGYPPYIHSLIKLASQAKVIFPDELKAFVEDLSDASSTARYDDEARDVDRTRAQTTLDQTRKAVKWLRQQLK